MADCVVEVECSFVGLEMREGKLFAKIKIAAQGKEQTTSKEIFHEPKFAEKIEAVFKDEKPHKKRHYKKRKKHAGGRPKKAKIGRPPKEKKVKKHAGGRPKKNPEDTPVSIDERFSKYQETYGCKPTCGSCEDEIPRASLAVYTQCSFYHQACLQREKEA